jgi:hypothetical protein
LGSLTAAAKASATRPANTAAPWPISGTRLWRRSSRIDRILTTAESLPAHRWFRCGRIWRIWIGRKGCASLQAQIERQRSGRRSRFARRRIETEHCDGKPAGR